MADASNENEIVPGEYVTPQCQARYRSFSCKWVPTKLCGKLWLCSECEKLHFARLMVRRVKDKLRRQRKRVT